MPILVGIDEAGFGPILGPLVVSSSAFAVPDGQVSADLWSILRRSVSVGRKHLAGRLLIADSKKAHSKSIGTKHLERTVLAALKHLGHEPAALIELLELLCPDCINRLKSYPWYATAATEKLVINNPDRALASTVFGNDMAGNNIELLQLKSRCLDVAYYNDTVAAVRNKSVVLFTATSQLIQNAWISFPDNDIHIIADRQGGRVRYRDNLLRMFPDMQLTILKESHQNSSYEMTQGNRRMRLHFVVGADDRFLPVSLASMVSKYLRELLMHQINRYFLGLAPELKPTAGYYKDGRRFIEDIRTHLPHTPFDKNQLIRCR